MLDYIILGIVQGLTEFLPVSSSAHLIIMQRILGLSSNELAISVVLHLGTCLALIIFFFKDILKLLCDARSVLLVVVVTLVTGLIGLSARGFFEGLFTSVRLSATALLFTGAILLLTKRFLQAKRDSLEMKDALILGLAQGCAIVPGISRSGITISTLLFRKVSRSTAFKFSFLASIPAVLGAAVLEAEKVSFAFQGEMKNFLFGFTFSFISGILTLRFLRVVVNKAKLHYFGYYCIIAGIVVLLVF